MRSSDEPEFRIGILAFNGCFASEIFAFSDLLIIANRIANQSGSSTRDRFKITVIGRPSPRVVAGGSTIGSKRWHSKFDLLVVPGFELVPSENLDRRLGNLKDEADFIERVAARGVSVASICVGAFLLGEAGLLDGRRATTAWIFANELARRYPGADVRPSSLLEEDHGVTTTAAFSSSQDLALRVIRNVLSPEIARATSRITLVAANRQSQAPFIDRSFDRATSNQFSDLVGSWLVERLTDRYDLSRLASEFNVSTRTLLRRFHAEAGISPLDYLQRRRVDAAKVLLETSEKTLTEIMKSVGYLDPGTFRRLFLDNVGITPADYRRQFRSSKL